MLAKKLKKIKIIYKLNKYILSMYVMYVIFISFVIFWNIKDNILFQTVQRLYLPTANTLGVGLAKKLAENFRHEKVGGSKTALKKGRAILTFTREPHLWTSL